MATRFPLFRLLPGHAAIVFLVISFTLPANTFCQQTLSPADSTAKAWRLLTEAGVLIQDSLEWDVPLEMIRQANALMQESGDSLFRARSAYGEARCLRRLGKYSAALDLLEVPIFYWQNKAADHPSDQLGDALVIRGQCQMELKQYDAARESLERAVFIFQNSVGEYHFKTAFAYNALGLLSENRSDWSSATEYYQKSIEVCLKIPPHLHACFPYNNLGHYYMINRDFSNAIKYYKLALEVRKRFLPADHRDVFSNLHSLAYCYSESGDMEVAMQYEEAALQVAKSRFGVNSLQYANMCTGLGFFGWSTGKNLSNGIKRSEEAITIFERIGYGTSGECGLAYSNLASCYFQKGDKAKALLYHQKALQIRKSVFGENGCDNTAISLLNIANSFNTYTDYEKALGYYKQALSIRLNHCEKYHPYTAVIYNNIGNCYMNLDSNRQALEYFTQSREIYTAPQLKGHFQVYTTLQNLGYYYYKNKEYDKALLYYDSTIVTAKHSYPGQSPIVARLFLDVIKLKLDQQDFKAAQRYIDSALLAINYSGDVEAVNSKYILVMVWELQAELLRRQYLVSQDIAGLLESRTYSTKALDLVYAIAVDYTESLSKSELIYKNYSDFEGAIWAESALERLQGGHFETAFNYAERSKALSLYQALRENSALNQSGIPDSLLDREQNLRMQIASCDKKRLEKLHEGLPETDTAVLTLDTVLLHLKETYERFIAGLNRDFPQYANLKTRVNTVDLHYLRDSLLAADEALLEFFDGDSSLFLFVVRKDTVVLQELKRDFPLDAWIKKFRQGIYGYYTADPGIRSDSLKNQTLNQYLEYGQLLYRKLIDPVKQWLPEKLIIAPDGLLGYIPFDALLAGAPQDINDFKSYPYLLDHYQISYTYSATFLKELREAKHNNKPEKSMLAFAPFCPGDTLAVAQWTSRTLPEFAPLPYTKEEVEEISQRLQGDLTTGNYATAAQFRAVASRYRIIHLATHAVADNGPDRYPFLAFSGSSDSLDDGRLYIQDIYNLKLNADLVVLSACETGIGKLQRGEGIVSLARAFACAGARSVVTSLWSVNDKSTSILMRKFYAKLMRGMSKDQALRMAQKDFLQLATVRNCHPYFWAAFVPVGDMESLPRFNAGF